MTRLVLAATLAASYGIYGPAFELLEAAPREPGSEEYLDSEKYQLRNWDLERPGQPARLHRPGQPHPPRQPGAAGRLEPALLSDRQRADARATARRRDDGANQIICVVEPRSPQRPRGLGRRSISTALGIDPPLPYQMHDLMTGARYLWHGRAQFRPARPAARPGAHLPPAPARAPRAGLRLLPVSAKTAL